MCISASDFYMKIINSNHTTIHWIQRYKGLVELSKCLNHSKMLGSKPRLSENLYFQFNMPMNHNYFSFILVYFKHINFLTLDYIFSEFLSLLSSAVHSILTMFTNSSKLIL